LTKNFQPILCKWNIFNQINMTKIEKLYNSIENLKELRVQLPDKLIDTTINLYQPKC